MDLQLFFKIPPPLDPEWIQHEQTASGLLSPNKVTDVKAYQQIYSKACRDRNAMLLTTRDVALGFGIKTENSSIPTEGHQIPIRCYYPSSKPTPAASLSIIYYHGGGLKVGDLDSEDLACRRICKGLQITVYSVEYRLLPDFAPDTAILDAWAAFTSLCEKQDIVLVGSSSGGQLAATVSQLALQRGLGDKIKGVLLRCPVTSDCTSVAFPAAYKDKHHSMQPAFWTSLQGAAVIDRPVEYRFPLEADPELLRRAPRHWIQLTTNDVYYSDGICYADLLKRARVDVRLDVVTGWPHTFWLKAPLLDRASRAETDMIEGLKWLCESKDERA
ncbi:AB hydrolase superfamily protein 5 [Phlyctema vagabunda]|uniref:AB hydrolase superfamily protein 5 n=1 Tax=Phlyctema vagabunda TaxID=108571 RepID=A0ABR4PG64_9HELO